MIVPINMLENLPKVIDKIFYTSDWHLNHSMVAFRRGYDSVQEMHKEMLATINTLVGPKDTLWYLGDFCLYNKASAKVVQEFLSQLICKNIYVIQGNHDPKKFLSQLQVDGYIKTWKNFKSILDIAFGHHMSVALFHHPVIDYHSERMPMICLHGHSHGTCTRAPIDLQDVGWDVFYKPVTLEQVLQYKYPEAEDAWDAYCESLYSF